MSSLSCALSWGSLQPSPLAASLGRGAAGAEGTAGSQGNGAVLIASSKSLWSPSDTDNPRAGGAGLNLSCTSAKPTPARQTPATAAPGPLCEPGTDPAPAMAGIWGRNPPNAGEVPASASGAGANAAGLQQALARPHPPAPREFLGWGRVKLREEQTPLLPREPNFS